MEGITLDMIRQAKAAKQQGTSTAPSAPEGVTLDDVLKAKYERNNDALSSLSNPSNEEKWLNLMSGGDALPAEDQGKLDTAQQIALGVASGVNSAAERVAKITSGANTLMTAGVNKVISKAGGPEDFLQTPELNKEIDKPFEATRQSIDEYTQNGQRLSDVFGINTVNTGSFVGDIAPSLVLPGSQVKGAATFGGKVLNAMAAGAKGGAIYGASEQAPTDDAGKIIAGGLFGSSVGAVLGGATQALASAAIGIGKFIGNRFIPDVKGGVEQTQGILNQIYNKDAAKYEKNLYNIIDDNAKPPGQGAIEHSIRDDLQSTAKTITARSQKEIDTAADLFQQANRKELQPYEHLRKIKENPDLTDTLQRYDTQLKNDMSPESTNAARYRDITTEYKGRQPNPEFRPNSVERYKIIKEEMDNSINNLLSQKGGKKLAADLIKQQKQLLDILDEVAPEYRAGRAVSQLGKVEKEALTKAGINNFSKGPNEAYAGLRKLILNPGTDPRDLRLIRDAYMRTNPDAWKGGVKEVFTNALNTTKGPAQPLDFIDKVMPNKAKQNLVFEALNFNSAKNSLSKNIHPSNIAPDNENLLYKLKALVKIKEEMEKPTVTSLVTEATVDKTPYVRGLQGSKANEFNKNAIKLLQGGQFDAPFDSIVRNKALTEPQKIDAVIELLLPKNDIGPKQQMMNKLFTVPPATYSAGFVSSKEDKK